MTYGIQITCDAVQAAQDNHFMHSTVSSGSATVGNTSVTLQALREFAGLHHELTEVQHGSTTLPHFLCPTSGNSANFQHLSWQPS